MRFNLFFIALVIIAILSYAFADNLVSLQMRLVDTNNEPISGTCTIKLYISEDEVTPLTSNIFSVSDGYLDVILDYNSYDLNVGQTYFLDFDVNNNDLNFIYNDENHDKLPFTFGELIQTSIIADNAVTGSKLNANISDLRDVNITNIANDKFLQYNGTSWIPVALTTINPINISSNILSILYDSFFDLNASGYLTLKNNSITTDKIQNATLINEDISNDANISWTKINKNGSYLKDLGDISNENPTDTQILVWNNSSQQWEPQTRVSTDTNVKSDATDPSSGYLSEKVDNTTIEVDNSEHVLRIKDSGITSEKIADYNITSNKIQSNAITTEKLADASIDGNKLKSSLEGDHTFTGYIIISNDLGVTGNLTIDGDLTVNGTTTTINSVNLDVNDAYINLNQGWLGNDDDVYNTGINFNRGLLDVAQIIWTEQNNIFKFLLGTTLVRLNIAPGTIANDSNEAVVGSQLYDVNTNINSRLNNSEGKIYASSGDSLGYLDSKLDNSTLEVNTNILQVKDSGITNEKIQNDSITTSKLLDSTIMPGDINTDNGASDGLVLSYNNGLFNWKNVSSQDTNCAENNSCQNILYILDFNTYGDTRYSLLNHNHDNSYYTKTELDNNFNNYYTNSQIDSNFGNYYNKNEIDNNLTSYYTKNEIDSNLSNYYTQTQIDSNLTNYYTKNEVDNNFGSYYTKSEIDNNFTNYALISHDHNSIYYTKTEVDTNFSNYYNKNEIDSNFTNYYNKTQVDDNFSNYYTQSQINTTLLDYYLQIDANNTFAYKNDVNSWGDARYATLSHNQAASTITSGTFSIDLNTSGNVKAGGNYICNSTTCYLISDLNTTGVSTLSGLSDVNTTGAANTNLFTYNSSSGKWVPVIDRKGYDVIVCSSGCDYTSIATAFNTGGTNKSYYIKSGTYYETSNVSVPANTYTYFEEKSGGVTIDFNNTSNIFLAYGAGTAVIHTRAATKTSATRFTTDAQNLSDIEANPANYVIIFNGMILQVTAASDAANTIDHSGNIEIAAAGANNYLLIIRSTTSRPNIRLTGLLTLKDANTISNWGHWLCYGNYNFDYSKLELHVNSAVNVSYCGLGNIGRIYINGRTDVASNINFCLQIDRSVGVQGFANIVGNSGSNSSNTYGVVAGNNSQIDLEVNISNNNNSSSGAFVGIDGTNTVNSSVRGISINNESNTANVTGFNVSALKYS